MPPASTPALTNLAEQLLDLAVATGIEQAEVYAYDTTSTPVDFESNRLKSLETKESHGLALRVVKDGRIGLAATTRLDDLRPLVDTAVELSAFGAEARFTLPAQIPSATVDVYDLATERLTVEQMVEQGQEMIDRVRAYDAEILCEAGVHRTLATTEILNSRGARGAYRESRYSLFIGGKLIRSEDFLDLYEYEVACGPVVDHRRLADALIRKFDLSKTVASVETRRLPVIFTPKGMASILWTYLSASLSGKAVLQGSSALSRRLGDQVFDPYLTVASDATIPGRPGSSPFDDEGIPARRLPLIERGVVTHFYYDLQTAGLAGTESTGNGYRSPETLPQPRVPVVTIEPGNIPFATMIAGVDEGLLVESTLGQPGNVYSGDFSGTVQTGFKIEKGQIAGRVKDTMVAGNIFADMQHLGGIGDTSEWVYGHYRMPHVFFPELGVSTRG